MSDAQATGGGSQDRGAGGAGHQGAEMEVDVVSAERRLYTGRATAVFARSVEGQIGILPGHQPVLLQLDPAPLAVDTPDGRQVFGVHGGFLEYRGERLTVLADGADRADEIDVSSAEEDVRVAREQVAESDDGEGARRRLQIAEMRLELAQG